MLKVPGPPIDRRWPFFASLRQGYIFRGRSMRCRGRATTHFNHCLHIALKLAGFTMRRRKSIEVLIFRSSQLPSSSFSAAFASFFKRILSCFREDSRYCLSFFSTHEIIIFTHWIWICAESFDVIRAEWLGVSCSTGLLRREVTRSRTPVISYDKSLRPLTLCTTKESYTEISRWRHRRHHSHRHWRHRRHWFSMYFNLSSSYFVQ